MSTERPARTGGGGPQDLAGGHLDVADEGAVWRADRQGQHEKEHLIQLNPRGPPARTSCPSRLAPRPVIYCAGHPPKALAIAPLKSVRFASRLIPRRTDAREDLVAGPIRGELLGAEHLGRAGARGRRRPAPVPAPPAPAADAAARPAGRDPPHPRPRARAADRRRRRGADVGPAGEWLLDNYHVVQEHIREVRESLPRGYYRELPELRGRPARRLSARLRAGDHADLAHRGTHRPRQRRAASSARSSRSPSLTIGELWAMPGHAAARADRERPAHGAAHRPAAGRDRSAADAAAARIARAGAGRLGRRSSDALGPLRRAARRRSPPIFVSRFLHQLRARARGSLAPLARLEQWIADEALSAEEATVARDPAAGAHAGR